MSGIFRYQKVSTFDQTNRALPKAPKNLEMSELRLCAKDISTYPGTGTRKKGRTWAKTAGEDFSYVFAPGRIFIGKAKAPPKINVIFIRSPIYNLVRSGSTPQ